MGRSKQGGRVFFWGGGGGGGGFESFLLFSVE